MKYIKELNIDFNDWENIDEIENIDDNIIKLMLKLSTNIKDNVIIIKINSKNSFDKIFNKLKKNVIITNYPHYNKYLFIRKNGKNSYYILIDNYINTNRKYNGWFVDYEKKSIEEL